MLKTERKKNIPKHVAFIMDGNRRWAKNKKLPIIEGHRQGIITIKKILRKSIKLNIKYLTFYGFSTENWKRSPREINDLKELLLFYLESEIENFVKNKINFSFIGDLSKFNNAIKKKLNELTEMTQKFSNTYFILALGYGSRNEIIKAINNCKKDLSEVKITEKRFSQYLMTKKFPDPDFVIRTSGEMRLSNFLLWQIAYSELYFTKTFWPDFNTNSYNLAIESYIKRKRRFGRDIK
ncbi:MAG: di-trans,poly-cis-decaprenylcistransferase [Rickettsiales bacterium]|nr:di-trans,poly-cis-decaprenylcistransferase [Rickettsiales bacterium]|tara:strand:+ start:28420 stop:29130 length:711 start_codon:yes stop_codon:yes gene_type:complete